MKNEKIMLSTKDLEDIKKCHSLLALTGEELDDYLDNNQISFDCTYNEITLEFNKYILELCTFAGDAVSPAFWSEVRFLDSNGNVLFFTEPLSDFEKFYVEDDKNEYGLTFYLDIENSCFNVVEGLEY